MISNRQGIIVWMHSLKQVKQLRRFGTIHFVSKRMKYVVIYLDMDVVENTIQKLNNLHFVKKVEVSQRPFLKTEYENISRRDDKEKEYDYKLGI
jgi:uncharacterized protein YlbG (UPF0298 family)